MINRLLGALAVGLWLCGGAFAQGWFPLAASAAADLNFSDNTGISGNLTVTRSTQETCESQTNGTLTYAAANTLCPGQFFGPVTNLMTRSQTTTGWAALGAGGALSTDSAGTAPDATSSRLIFTDNSTSVAHQFEGPSLNFTSGNTYGFSGYFQQGTCAGATHECKYVSIYFTPAITMSLIYVDIAACQQVSGNAGLLGLYFSKVTAGPFAGGCHFYFTFTAATTQSGNIFIAMVPEVGSNTATFAPIYVGSGSTIYWWGIMVNVGTAFFPYCPTAGAAATCNADNVASAGALKTTLEGSSLRVVAKVARFRGGTPSAASTIVGTGSALTGLGMAKGFQATTSWPVTATLKSAGQILQGANVNYLGLSADASGRCLAMNGQTSNCDANGLSATASEFIGSLSNATAYCNCVIAELKVWNTRNDAAMLLATANPRALPLVASYTGAIGYPARINQTMIVPGTATQMMTRSIGHWSENASQVQFKFAGYYINSGSLVEMGLGAPTPVTAALEYPIGTCTQLLFSASPTGIIPDASTLMNDVLSINTVAGEAYALRTFRTNPNGMIWNNSLGEDQTYGLERTHYGTTGITDQTTSCDAITSTNTAGNYWPDAIVGPTQLTSYCFIGDSITLGTGDVRSDSFYNMGQIARWVAPYYSTLNMGTGGDQAHTYITNNTNRKVNLQYCTGMVVPLGINDIRTGGRTALQVEADLQTIYGLNTLLNGGSGPVWGVAIMGWTTTTDNWATVANQTVVAGNASVVTLDTWIRANTAGIAGYFENSDIGSTSRNSNTWNVNSLPFGWTIDGLHWDELGYLNIMNTRGFPAQLNFLLKRDLDPANDNSPVGLNQAA